MSRPIATITAQQAAPTPLTLAGPLNTTTWEERELYGGAIVACIPKRFSDCSAFRHIPDHQEVWADADTDQSIIIELNSMDEEVTDQQAAIHYQHELGIANEALSNDVVQSGLIPNENIPGFASDVHKSFCISSQLITKFRESSEKANSIQIYLAVLRLRSVRTDLLVSFNVPLRFGSGSSSEGKSVMSSEENVAVIQGVLNTIRVKEWSLFGEEEQTENAAAAME